MGQRNCTKHVEFCSKNKFEKLVHIVGCIVRNTTHYKNSLLTRIEVSLRRNMENSYIFSYCIIVLFWFPFSFVPFCRRVLSGGSMLETFKKNCKTSLVFHAN